MKKMKNENQVISSITKISHKQNQAKKFQKIMLLKCPGKKITYI